MFNTYKLSRSIKQGAIIEMKQLFSTVRVQSSAAIKREARIQFHIEIGESSADHLNARRLISVSGLDVSASRY